MGENCSTGCATKNHKTWGECVKAKRQMVGYCQSAKGLDRSKQNKWDADLALYKSAHDEGIRPDATGRRSVEFARKLSDMHGAAYGQDGDFRVIPKTMGDNSAENMEPVFQKHVDEVMSALPSDAKALLEGAKQVKKEQGLDG